ncbi:MAG: hypothetical protein QM703_24895 [Gemmatales bacterium]
MKTLRLFALSVVAAGLVAGSAYADEGKPVHGGETRNANGGQAKPATGGETRPVNSGEVKPVKAEETKPAPVAKAALNESPKLEAMVKELKLTYEKKLDEKANVVYFNVTEYGPESFCFNIELSKNLQYTWILFPCGKAPESGIPPEIMQKMLVEQSRMCTAFFQYDPNTRMIMLKMPMATPVDAKQLKQEINWVLKDASRTRSLWDSTQWSPSAAK